MGLNPGCKLAMVESPWPPAEETPLQPLLCRSSVGISICTQVDFLGMAVEMRYYGGIKDVCTICFAG